MPLKCCCHGNLWTHNHNSTTSLNYQINLRNSFTIWKGCLKLFEIASYFKLAQASKVPPPLSRGGIGLEECADQQLFFLVLRGGGEHLTNRNSPLRRRWVTSPGCKLTAEVEPTKTDHIQTFWLPRACVIWVDFFSLRQLWWTFVVYWCTAVETKTFWTCWAKKS